MISRHRKRLMLTACLLLLVLIAGLQTVQAMVAEAVPRRRNSAAPAPVLAIDHDLDLSEYDRVVVGGGSLARTSDAALAGTAGGLAVRLGGTQPVYAQANFAQLTSPRYRFRFYLDPNGLAMNYRSIQSVVALHDAKQAQKVWVTMRYRDGSYHVRANARDDEYDVHQTAWHPISDDEHYIEVLVEYASSRTASDGRVVLWIDGNRKAPIANIDLDGLDKPAQLRMGSNWVLQDKTSGTYYLDEFVLRADGTEIGPVFEQPTPQPTATYTHTPTPAPVAAAGVNLRHEDDLAEYDNVIHDTHDLAQSAAAGLGGTLGGMQVAIDDNSALFGEKEFGSLADAQAYRFRHYVNPNGLSMPNLSQITLAQVRGTANSVVTRLQYTRKRGYVLYVRYVDDNKTWRSMPNIPISNAEHYLEVLVEFASGPSSKDGRVTVWLDDVQRAQHKDLDLYDTPKRPDHVRLGAPWVSKATIRGMLYLDEFVLRNNATYIGPATASPEPTATHTPTLAPTQTPVPTSAPTQTPAPTSTPTQTPAPTSTPTRTPAPTPMPTLTPTMEPTQAPTQTPTHTPTTAPTQPPTTTPAPDGEVNVRHEDNLAEYDSLVHDGGDLAQTAAAALGGTQGGMQATVDDDSTLYGEKAFGSLDDAQAYRFRHYVNPNGLVMPDPSQITLAQVRGKANSVVTRLQYTQKNGYRLYVRYVDDNGAWTSMPAVPIGNEEHYLEVLVEFASGPSANDGRVTCWLDDVQIAIHRDLNLYDTSKRPNRVRLGVPWASSPAIRGTLYLDEFVLRDNAAYIGPASTQPGTPRNTPTATPSAPQPTPTAAPTTAPTATPHSPQPTPTAVPTATPALTGHPITVLGTVRQTVREVSGGNFHHAAQGVTTAVDPVGALNIKTLNPRHVRVNLDLRRWEPVNDNGDPNKFNWSAFRDSGTVGATFDLMQERAKQDATFVASIWNVPDWAVSNPGSIERRRIRPDMYPEVAEGIAAFILRAQMEYGARIDYISVNEPDIGVFISMPPEDLPPLILETGRRLDKLGLHPRWLLADVSILKTCREYAATVWSYPEVRPYIGPLACHSYDQLNRSDKELQDLAAFAQARGREFWVTEAQWRAHLDRDLYPTWQNAINLSVAYSRLLKEGRATTMYYWQMLRNGFSNNDGTKPYPALDMLAQFKREIPNGSQIVATSPNTDTLYSLAAKTSNDFALFMINSDVNRQTVQIRDLPRGTYYLVTSDVNSRLRFVRQINVTGNPIQLNLNLRSVNVLTTRPPAAQ